MKRFIALTLLAAGAAFGATITPYSTQTAFNAALTLGSPSVTEGFNTASSSVFTTPISTSLVSITFNGGAGTQPRNISGGVLNDQVSSLGQTTLIDPFATGVYAVSGLWNLFPGSTPVGGGIIITVNFVGGGSQNVTRVLGSNPSTTTGDYVPTGIFFGFTSDVAIESILLTGSTLNSGLVETYSVDNLTFVSTVPEPSTFGLMGLALVGLGTLRARRK